MLQDLSVKYVYNESGHSPKFGYCANQTDEWRPVYRSGAGLALLLFSGEKLKGDELMRTNVRRIVSLVAAITLLLTCAISGLVLPMAAEPGASSTFKLADDVYYLGPNDSGGYTCYFATKVLTPDGQPYTEPVTWSTSNPDLLKISDAATGRFQIPSTAKNTYGEVIVTATNAAGESASCKVVVTFDGEIIPGGDFENLCLITGTSRWKELLKEKTAGKQGELVADPQDPTNTVMAFPCDGNQTAIYYSGANMEQGKKYKLSFDVKGADATSPILYITNKHSNAVDSNIEGYTASAWQYITTQETEWTHVEYILQIKDTSNRNYLWGIDNTVEGKTLYFDNFSFTQLGTAEAIELSEEEVELKVGEELELTVAPYPSDATFNRVKWISSDEKVATVVDGKIKAIGEGTATITALSGALFATCTVNVIVPPATFKLADEVAYVAPGDSGGYVTYFATHAITPEGEPYTEPLTWSSDNTAVLSISNQSTGLFKTSKNVTGEATITATNAAGETASCKVYVVFDGELIVGGDFENRTENIDTTRWKDLLKEKTSSKQGQMVADPQDPTNTVMAWPCNGSSPSAFYYMSLTVEANRTYKFSMDVKGYDGTATAMYFKTGSQGCTVNSSSVGTPVGGWQSIPMKAEEWTHVEYIITTGSSVNRNYLFGFDHVIEDTLLYYDNISLIEMGTATSIELSETELELEAGNEVTLEVTASPEGSKFNRVQWLSSNEDVATVVDGKVVAVGGGTATITALSGTLYASCTVTVKGGNVPEDTSGYVAKVDFDSPMKGFQTAKNEQFITEGVGVDGSKGFLFSGAKNDYADIAFDANIMMMPGETYILRFQTKGGAVRLEFGPQGTYYQIPLTETYGNPSAFTPSNAEWTTYQRVIRPTTSAFNFTWIRAKLDCDNTPVYIDNITLIKVDDLLAETGSFDLEENRYGLTALQDLVAAGTVVADPLNSEDTTDRVLQFPKMQESEDAPYALTGKPGLYLDSDTTKLQTGVVYAGRPYTLTMDVYGGAMGIYFDPAKGISVLDQNAEKGADGWYQVGGDATATGWKTYTFTIYTEENTAVLDNLFVFAKNADDAADYSDVKKATYIDNIVLLPKEVAPESLVLGSTELLMGLGNTHKLSVAPVPGYATIGKQTWASSNEAVATVKNGNITAVGVGTTTITLTANDISVSCEVTVVDEAVSFTFVENKMHLAIGTSKSPILVTTPTNTKPGTINWTSNDTAVATVDANGRITAVGNGTAVITAQKGSFALSCTVTVDEEGERISGGDFEMNDWDNDTLTTNIIKTGVGSVVVDGDTNVLTLPASASSVLYFANLNLEDGRDYSLTFKAKGTKVRTHVNADATTRGAGEFDTSLSTGSWTTVTVKFTYKAGADKNTVIGISNQGGSSKTLTIDNISLVQLPKVSGIAVVPGEIEVLPGSTNPLKWQAVPQNAFISSGDVRWSSSDSNIVAVDELTGSITALGKDGQSADITVTDGNFSKTVTVKITDYANLLWNGDFEQGASVNWGNNSKIKPGIGKDGSYGLQLSTTGDNYFKGDIAAKPGTKYVLSWDYLPKPGTKFKVWSSKLGIGNNSGSSSGEGWKTKTTVFTTPASMDLTNVGWIIAVVSEGLGTDGYVVVDNVSIKLYSSGVEAESIKLDKTSMTIMPGRTGNLSIMATPIEGDTNRVTWTSSNEDVATVEYGVVTGVGKGTAKITATLKSGLSASCTVRVSGNDAFIINGTFSETKDDSWIFSDEGAAIVPDLGTLDSNAVSLTKGGSISQKITGLKPETSYQIFVRFRANASSKMVVTLGNDAKSLYSQVLTASTGWTKGIYDFTTDATVSETDEFLLTIAPDAGVNGPIYIDNVLVAEKATMIDFVVQDVFWLLDDPMAATDQVKPGEKLNFYVLIKNQGTDAVKEGESIVIDICMDGKVVLSIPYTFAAGMESGGFETIAATAPWAAVEGDHVISARVNATLSVLEIDDTNNNTQQKDLRVNDVILEVPEIAQMAGFNELIFSDDFNTTDTFDTMATGGDGYKWYVIRPWDNKNATQYLDKDYSVKDGILTLHSVVPTYNYTLGTHDLNTQLGFDWQYGYLEVMFRIPRPRENTSEEDGVPAIWSLPPSKLHSKNDSNLNWVEMDWMEYWGINGMNSDKPGGFYTISIHDTYKKNGETVGQYKNKGFSKEGLGDGEWHQMSFLWQKGIIIAYLDGEEVLRQTYAADDYSDPWPTLVENKDGTYQMVGAFSHLDEEELVLFLGGSKDNPLEMEYVRIWSGSGDGITPPDPDDEENVAIDMAAEDFWYNYCTDDWGDPITAINDENYQNVLYGQEIWEQLTEERRAEINALLESYGQPTYDELLADALILADGGELGGDTDSPDTGEGAAALPDVVAMVTMSAAALWITRKRKK